MESPSSGFTTKNGLFGQFDDLFRRVPSRNFSTVVPFPGADKYEVGLQAMGGYDLSQ